MKHYGDITKINGAAVEPVDVIIGGSPCQDLSTDETPSWLLRVPTKFFRNKDKGISVTCGCFSGTIDEFLQQVAETHGDNKHGQVYRQAAELAKLQIELD